MSLQSADDKSVQEKGGISDANSNNYNDDSGGNMSSLSVADVHVTTVIPLQRQHASFTTTTTSSSSGSSSGRRSGSEAEFDVVINQSHYELHQPPLTSRDVIVYVMHLVCVTSVYRSYIKTRYSVFASQHVKGGLAARPGLLVRRRYSDIGRRQRKTEIVLAEQYLYCYSAADIVQ